MPSEIFILEDDTSFSKILEICLRNWREDISFTITRSVSEAKQVLENVEKQFLLAIIDQHLPDGFGLEILEHPKLQSAAVLAVSADPSPELPGDTLLAGAQHFLGKKQVTEPLFLPLIEALVERKKLELELLESKLKDSRLKTITVLLATLRHEINNPLGAVLGAAYLLRSTGQLDENQASALRLVEDSGNRIKHVIKQLCETAELEEVSKANERVFQVPGDSPWVK